MPLYRAFEKYGFDDFDFSVIVDGLSSLKDLMYGERYLIAYYNTTNSIIGYNCSEGGEGLLGFSGDKNPMYGKKRPEVAERNKMLFTGKKLSKSHLEKLRIASTGKVHSKGSIKKMSESKKKNWEDGVYGSEEYRKKMSESKKGKENPLKRKKIICHETGEVFESLEAAALHFTGNKKKSPNILCHLKGKTRSAYGHTFSYVKDAEIS